MKTSARFPFTPSSWLAVATGLLSCLLFFSPLQATPDPGNTDQQLQLGGAETAFEALLRPANRTEPRGLVILLHGEDQHLDFPEVIATLRRQLADDGWHTLSLAMPEPGLTNGEPDYKAYLDQAQARIQATLDYVRDEHQIDRIYLMGHGLGGAAALAFLTREEGVPPVLKGFVGISLGDYGAETSEPRLSVRLAIEKLTIPMLDVYAQGDRMEAGYYAKARRDAAKRNGKLPYRQLMLPAQDHQFRHYEALLAKRIYGWLESNEQLLDAEEQKRPPRQPRPEVPAMAPAPLQPEDQAPATVPMEMPDMPDMPFDGEVPPPEGPGVILPDAEPSSPPPPPPQEGSPAARENLF